MEEGRRHTKWIATFYEGEYHYFDDMPSIVKKFGYQDEVCPTTGKKHRQAWLLTTQQTAKAIRKKLYGVHIDPAMSVKHWENIVNYCKKTNTRDLSGNTIEEVKNQNYMRQSDIYILIAEHVQGYVTLERIQECNKFKWDVFREEYWYGVNSILLTRPELATFFSAPASEKFWMRTRITWNHLYLKSKQEV